MEVAVKRILFVLTAISVSFASTYASESNDSSLEIVSDSSAEAEVASGLFNNAYLAYGTGGSFLHSGDAKFNRWMGVVGLGVGHAFNKLYVGGECLLDIMRSKSKENEGVRSNGLHPQVTLKAGWIGGDATLFYGKVGGMHSKGKYYGNDKSKFSSLIGGGIYRAFNAKYGAGVEADYSTGFKENGKKVNQGWNLRVLLHYNVPF